MNKRKLTLDNRLVIIGFFFIFFALRLINLRTEELWYDEYYNLLVAYKLSLTQIIAYVKYLYHPPFYYWLMHFWLKIFGLNELSGRVPSVIFSLIALFIFVKIIKIISNNPKTLFLSLFFLTFSSINVEYSQEARPYTLILLFFLVSIYLILKNLGQDRIKWPDLVILSAVNLLGLYSHYDYLVNYAALSGGLLLLWFLKPKFRKSIKWLLITLVTSFLGWLPWLPIIVSQTSPLAAYGSLMQKEKVGLQLIIANLTYFYFIKINRLVNYISLLGVISWFILVYRQRKAIKSNYLFLYLCLCLVLLLVFLYFSPLSRAYSYTWQRHFLSVNCLFLLLMVYFLIEVNQNKVISFFLIILFAITSFFSTPLVLKNDSRWFYNHQYRQLAIYINKNEKPGDLLLVPKITFDMMLRRFYQGKNLITTIINDREDKNGLPTLATVNILYNSDEKTKKSFFEKEVGILLNSYQRIWIVNNYGFEDQQLLGILKDKSEWQMTSIVSFPQNRLILAEKNGQR